MAILRLVLILSLAAAATDREPAPPRYSIESLGPVRVLSVNDSGWTTGSSGAIARPRAFVQIRGRRHAVEGLGERGGHAVAVNAAGVAVGSSWDAPMSSSAFAWRDGHTTRLPVPSGVRWSRAVGINGRGDIVGHGRLGERQVALVWSGDSVRILPPPETGGSAIAVAMNDSGWVVGQSQGARIRGVLWRGTRAVDLGTPANAYTWPADVNGRGQVVGSLNTGIATTRAFLWENGRTTELSPGLHARATAINDSGQIVGMAMAEDELEHPALWEGGRMVYLKDLIPPIHGWTLLSVVDINNDGWIVGMGRRAGEYEAWLMKPIR